MLEINNIIAEISKLSDDDKVEIINKIKMQTSIPVFNIHTIQCDKILELLHQNDFVPTQSLVKLGIYQYNSRIFELRRQDYNIVSIRKGGICGFKLFE